MAHLPNGKWIPDSTAREYSDLRALYGAELGRMLESGSAVTEEWNRVLYQIDPELRLVKARESADFPGLTPGFYHLVRRNALGAPSLIPVERDGEYTDPDSSMLEKLRENDLWNDRVAKDRRQVAEELERQRQHAKAREKEERHDEIAERWKAVSNPGVSMASAGKWRYRAAAPRA